MKKTLTLIAIAASLGGGLAQAQSSSTTTTGATPPATPRASSLSSYDERRASWIPGTRSGYFGLSAGRTNFPNNCGLGGLSCDDNSTAGQIYLGGYFNPMFGAEIGYQDLGSMDRAGGRTSAKGLNFSLVGRAPMTDNFSLYGKLGATYGRTHVSALPGTGVASGSESGWGPAFAVGVNYDLTTNWSAVLELQRQRFDFAGNNRGYVNATNIGLKYRF